MTQCRSSSAAEHGREILESCQQRTGWMFTTCTGDPSALNSDGEKGKFITGSSHHQGGQVIPFIQGAENQPILLRMENQLLLQFSTALKSSSLLTLSKAQGSSAGSPTFLTNSSSDQSCKQHQEQQHSSSGSSSSIPLIASSPVWLRLTDSSDRAAWNTSLT